MAAASSARRSPKSRVPFAEAVRRRALGNGAELAVLENHFNPTVAVSGTLHAGSVFAPPGRRLIAPMTAGELAKGTRKHTKLQIAEDLESRGASLSFSSDSSDPVGVDIGGAALSRDVDLLLDRLVEILRTPVFPSEELEKEKKRVVGSIRQQLDQPSVRAYEEAARRIYPPEHPFHRRTGEKRIAPWAPGPKAGFPALAVPKPSPGRDTIVMPDKASADVVMLEPSTLLRNDPAYLACTLANSALGQSSLTSRLGVRVRDIEGLTYGIHSNFHATHIAGPFVVSVTVKPESRDAAVASTLDEITRFLLTGLTRKELKEEKSSRVGKFQVDLASNAGIAQALDAALYYGLGLDYLDRFPSLVESITKEQADEEFRKRVHPDRFTIVSAGSF